MLFRSVNPSSPELDAQCAKGEECSSGGTCFIPCSTNTDCSAGNTCSSASSSGDDGLTGITLTDAVPGQGNRSITLSTTTLAPGASETYSSFYYPTFLGTCMGDPATSCVSNEDCASLVCTPMDLPDTVTVTGQCNSIVCSGTASDNASASCSLCPTFPNCPFNLQ